MKQPYAILAEPWPAFVFALPFALFLQLET